MIDYRIIPYTLTFKEPAGTSRGVYTERQVYYILLHDSESNQFGIGECAPLPQLSADDLPDYVEILSSTLQQLATGSFKRSATTLLRPYPSMLFAVETALRHLKRGSFALFNTPFARGQESIRTNGLIWMGDYKRMLARIEEKLAQHDTCIKLKIGAIDFDKELELIRYIRRQPGGERIELRVDANGAFSPTEVEEKLRRLAEYDIHSIEQPVRQGQWRVLQQLCRHHIVPIALDEELIGHYTLDDKRQLLEAVRPQYIVLKPSLHGGWSGCEEWIRLAESHGIGYWITSALESNIGLNAIAQWCATLPHTMAQGLGTGKLFTNNLPTPLVYEDLQLGFDPTAESIDLTPLWETSTHATH